MAITPPIVVIIVNYHVADQALAAVDSVASEGPPVDIRLVDNSCCPREVRRLRETGLPVQINQRNLGFGRACNLVYGRTQSRYVLLLNPDARLLPGALGQMHDYLEAHADIAAVSPRAYWDGDQRLLLPPNPLPRGRDFLALRMPGQLGKTMRRRLDDRLRRAALTCWQAQQPTPQAALSGGHVLLRRRCVDAAGGLFDPRFFLYWEDTDLFLRLRRTGARSVLLPDAGVVHPTGASSRVDPPRGPHPAAVSTDAYLAKYHRWCAWLGTRLPLALAQPHPDDPPTTRLRELEVPSQWRQQWCIELSATPSFLWPLGMIGSGARIELPRDSPDWLGAGGGYARLGPTATGARPRYLGRVCL